MQKVMSFGENVFLSLMASPVLSEFRIHVRDGRREFVFRRFDVKELDQLANDTSWLSGQLRELDSENGNIGMFFDEAITMLCETALQTFAGIIVCREPLTTMLVGSILQTSDGGLDVAMDRDDP